MNFEEGMTVIVHHPASTCSIGKVQRVTKTQAIVDGRRFNRRNGVLIGGSGRMSDYITPATEDEIVEVQEKNTRKDLLQKCRFVLDRKSSSVQTDTLWQVWYLLDEE